MEDYSSLEQYPWPDDIYNEDGELNMDILMAVLDSNPELMHQFQCKLLSGVAYAQIAQV